MTVTKTIKLCNSFGIISLLALLSIFFLSSYLVSAENICYSCENKQQYLYSISETTTNYTITYLNESLILPKRVWLSYEFYYNQIIPVIKINNYSQISNLVTKINATVWYITFPYFASKVKSVNDSFLDLGYFKRNLKLNIYDSANHTYQVLIKVINGEIRIYFNPNNFTGVIYPLFFRENTITIEYAQDKTATALNTNGGDIPINAIDRNINTYWHGSLGGGYPNWWRVAINLRYQFNYVKVMSHNDRTSKISIQTSNDDSNWITQNYSINVAFETLAYWIFPLNNSSGGRYVRVYAWDNTESASVASFIEVEVWYNVSTLDISGYINNTGNNFLENVNITNNQTGDNNLSLSTGFYKLSLLNGTYLLKFNKTGYNDGYKIIIISGANLINQNITLNETALAQGQIVYTVDGKISNQSIKMYIYSGELNFSNTSQFKEILGSEEMNLWTALNLEIIFTVMLSLFALFLLLQITSMRIANALGFDFMSILIMLYIFFSDSLYLHLALMLSVMIVIMNSIAMIIEKIEERKGER